ncbi:nitroreductase family protein [Planctomicrobium sp. SH661]|uniref:nitroreductase family protein n=1 Tax=Planctomicrobium sp. SH661 TaxID=3448124 RepID=UPI003F5C698B
MGSLPNPLEHRQPDHNILDLFLKRWSPRALTGEAIPQSTLNELFEAARWAPSTYNEQEWRFLYAHRDTEHWPTFFGILMEANQTWCKNAGVLILALSKKTFTMNGKPNPVHSVDTGMAVQNLLLQAASMHDVVAHGMAGFDRSKARTALKIPEDFEIECMIAVGRPGDPEELPQALREREVVTGRKKIEEFAQPGSFNF